ncbi:MAG: NAD(P)-dependent alcohol dehydrogenase [Luteolibacter sp.]
MVLRLRAASVNSGDSRVRGCRFPQGMSFIGRLAMGWHGPRQAILGTDGAGVVETLGPGVQNWRVGDEVMVVKGTAMGCHAERVLVKPGNVVVRKPESLSWAEAVSLPFGGQTARFFLTKAGLKRDDEVLVIGASGAVGGAALQWISLMGARAIAVTRSANNEWVRQLGATEVIDYTTTDYAAGGRRFDLVMDCMGAGSFRTLRHLVKPGGAYLAVAGGLPDYLARTANEVRCVTGMTPESADLVGKLVELTGSGRFRPMVGACFPFEEVPAAHALVDGGHKRGVVVVEVGHQNS